MDLGAVLSHTPDVAEGRGSADDDELTIDICKGTDAAVSCGAAAAAAAAAAACCLLLLPAAAAAAAAAGCCCLLLPTAEPRVVNPLRPPPPQWSGGLPPCPL